MRNERWDKDEHKMALAREERAVILADKSISYWTKGSFVVLVRISQNNERRNFQIKRINYESSGNNRN